MYWLKNYFEIQQTEVRPPHTALYCTNLWKLESQYFSNVLPQIVKHEIKSGFKNLGKDKLQVTHIEINIIQPITFSIQCYMKKPSHN